MFVATSNIHLVLRREVIDGHVIVNLGLLRPTGALPFLPYPAYDDKRTALESDGVSAPLLSPDSPPRDPTDRGTNGHSPL